MEHTIVFFSLSSIQPLRHLHTYTHKKNFLTPSTLPLFLLFAHHHDDDHAPSHADAPTNSSPSPPHPTVYTHSSLLPLTNEDVSSLPLFLLPFQDDDDHVPSHADAPANSTPSTFHTPKYSTLSPPASTQALPPDPGNYS